MVFKVNGDFAPEKHAVAVLDVSQDPIIQELTLKLNEIHRGTSVPSDGGSSSSLGTEA
jgi:hypothetical protein